MLLIWTSLFLFVLITGCEKNEQSDYHELQFFTESYPPFNYEENGTIAGLAPELLAEISRELDFTPDINMLSWSDAYESLANTHNGVLFSIVLNSERNDLFKWAGPYAALEYHFYMDSQNDILVNSLEDAKNLNAIGVVEGYSITAYLEESGFANLAYLDNHQEGFLQLLEGEIDLYPSDRISAKAALSATGNLYYHVKDILPIRTELLYFAFNEMVPDQVVSDFQNEIDRLKESGFLSQLSQKHLNTANYPGTMQIYTEAYPPLTFMNNYGEISGFGADIVFEIMNRNDIYEEVRLTTWSNAYEMALVNPNFCLFTMDRTEQRDPLFQWVGPIGTNETFFYTQAGSGITINSIEDAMNLDAVGTVNSWYSDQRLRDLGFTNLVSDGDPGVIVDWLMSGEVDAFVCSGITISDILQSQDFSYADVVPEFSLMSSDFYISFSTNTPEAIVNQWQSTFEDMEDDGTYDAIYNKWLDH